MDYLQKKFIEVKQMSKKKILNMLAWIAGTVAILIAAYGIYISFK